MTEQQLFKHAENYYFQDGKELNAIAAFKELLRQYPHNVDGWTHLATMQNKITDFDGAIKSINMAIEIRPKDNWIINQKCAILSLISKFPAEGQIYFDQQTKEAHEIKTYSSKRVLVEDLIGELTKLVESEDCKLTDKYSNLWRLAVSSRQINENHQAIEYLQKAVGLVPEKYDEKRKDRELANLFREISANYVDLEDYQNAITFLNKAFDYGLDDFSRINLFEMYKKQGEIQKGDEVLADLLKRIDSKFETTPESAYITQKVEVLKLRNDINGLITVVKQFEKLEPLSTYHKELKDRLTREIENYLQQNA